MIHNICRFKYCCLLLMMGPQLLSQSEPSIRDALISASQDLRQVATASKKQTYFASIESMMMSGTAQRKQLANNALPGNLTPFQKRLARIWQARLASPDRFQKIRPYAVAAPLDATQYLIAQRRTPTNERQRVNLARIELDLLHPDLIAAAKAHPDIYETVLDIGREIRAEAKQLLQRYGRDTQNLASRYAARMEAIFTLAENGQVPMNTLRDIVAAAQPPNFGATYPPKVQVNPDDLLAWEEMTLQTPNLELKCQLVRLIANLDQINTAPCLGMVLEQVFAVMKTGQDGGALLDLSSFVFNYFREHPSQAAAIALAQALAYAQSGENPLEIAIWQYLNSPEWQSVFQQLEETREGQKYLLQLQNQSPQQ